MTDEQRDHLAELKTFAWAAPLLLPLIQKRKRIAFELLLSDFRQGKREQVEKIAELNAYAMIEMELNQKIQEFNTLETKDV